MDVLLIEAIESILSTEMASKAFLQRRFKIGYERASKLIDIIEKMEIISPEDINHQRSISITLEDWLSIIEKRKSMELHIDENGFEENTFSIDEIWKKVCQQLRTELSENSFNTWFQDVVVQHSGDKIILITPNNFHKEIIESRYTSLITHLFHMFVDSEMTLNIVSTNNTI